jgi:hypothetical protein
MPLLQTTLDEVKVGLVKVVAVISTCYMNCRSDALLEAGLILLQRHGRG